jgi:hypothetical protein
MIPNQFLVRESPDGPVKFGEWPLEAKVVRYEQLGGLY